MCHIQEVTLDAKKFSLNFISQNVCYYHVTCEFHSKSTLYSLPECQGTPCSEQVPYLKLSESNGIRTYNHLVRK